MLGMFYFGMLFAIFEQTYFMKNVVLLFVACCLFSCKKTVVEAPQSIDGIWVNAADTTRKLFIKKDSIKYEQLPHVQPFRYYKFTSGDTANVNMWNAAYVVISLRSNGDSLGLVIRQEVGLIEIQTTDFFYKKK